MKNIKIEDKFVLSLSTKTWIKDIFGLFDYDSSQTRNSNNTYTESTCIVRRRDEIIPVNNPFMLPKGEEFMFNIVHDELNKFYLDSKVPKRVQPTQGNLIDLNDKIWYIIKSDPIKSNTNNHVVANTNEDYYLCKNDVIKLGIMKYSINEINIPSRLDNIERAPPLNDKSKYDIVDLNKNTEPVFQFTYNAKDISEYKNIPDDEKLCKICYSDSNERKYNPLVHLCNCKGGLRFSHYLCIKKFLETKLQITENQKKTVKNYMLIGFNCEICKTPYPFRFILYGIDKPFELISLDKPVGCDYIVLESLNQIVDKKNNLKIIYVVKLDSKKEIMIGRAEDADIYIRDRTVSRNHAQLK